MTKTLRGITVVAALASLAACADNSPVASNASAPAFSKNGGNSGAALSSKVEIKLARDVATTFLTAKGSAKFEAKGTQNELEIEVEHIAPGTKVIFLLGGVQVGTGTADAAGEAELKLRGAAAPTTVAGLAVAVTTDANAPIVAGTF